MAKKYCIVYKSAIYNASETIEILKKCPPDVFFKLYHKNKKEVTPHLKDITMKKSRMDRLEESIAQIGRDLVALNQKVDNGFKQVNTRLDYIVKANNLKDNK